MKGRTDEQIIQSLRRAQRYRRAVGVVLFLFGIVAAAALILYVNVLEKRWIALLAEMQPGTVPTTQRTEELFNAVQFLSGYQLGSTMATGLATAAGLAVGGLVLLLPNPKDRLLLKVWDSRDAHD